MVVMGGRRQRPVAGTYLAIQENPLQHFSQGRGTDLFDPGHGSQMDILQGTQVQWQLIERLIQAAAVGIDQN